MKFTFCCVCLAALIQPGLLHAAPESPLQNIVENLKTSAARDVTGVALCDERDPALVVSKEKVARFTVRKSGRITVDAKAAKHTITFEGARPVVKLRTLPSNGAEPRTVACGDVVPSTIYEVPDQDSHLIAVSVFDLVDHDEKYLAEYRAKALVEMRQVERNGLHADPTIERFAALASLTLLDPDARIKDAHTAASLAHTSLQDVETRVQCASIAAKDLLQSAICDETLEIDAAISSLDALLGRVAAAKIEDRHKLIETEKPNELLAILKPVAPPTQSARDTQCARMRRYRWLDLKQAPRLLTAVSLPIVDAITVGEDGQKVKPVDAATSNIDRALLITGIPYGQKTKFAEVQGDRVTLSGVTLFSTFLGQALPHLPPTFAGARNIVSTLKATQTRIAELPAEQKRSLGAALFLGLDGGTPSDEKLVEQLSRVADKLFEDAREELLVPKLTMLSLVCTDEKNKKDPKLHIEFDADLPASSGLEHRAYIFSVERDHKVSVSLCEGTECTGKDDDKQVKTRVSLTPSRAYTFTLLAEVSAGLGIHGFDSMSTPEFKPALGPEGPDQIYEMQQTANPADAISTSLLLALHYSDTSLIAFGPSLTTGTSGNAFKQWAFRWGRHLGSSGLVFTVGASVRAIPFPDDYRIGDRVSVPRGMTTKPPDIRTSFAAEYQVEIGLAFDLSGVTSLASDAYKAIGGK